MSAAIDVASIAALDVVGKDGEMDGDGVIMLDDPDAEVVSPAVVDPEPRIAASREPIVAEPAADTQYVVTALVLVVAVSIDAFARRGQTAS